MTEWPGVKVNWNPEELEAEWREKNKAFLPQNEEVEFGHYKPVDNKPAMTFREIAEVEGVDASMIHRVFKRGMEKIHGKLEAAGITKESIRADPEISWVPKEIKSFLL
jgi:hypothetical protein